MHLSFSGTSRDVLRGRELAVLRAKAPKSIKDLIAAVIKPLPADKAAVAELAAELESRNSDIVLNKLKIPQTMLPKVQSDQSGSSFPTA